MYKHIHLIYIIDKFMKNNMFFQVLSGSFRLYTSITRFMPLLKWINRCCVKSDGDG